MVEWLPLSKMATYTFDASGLTAIARGALPAADVHYDSFDRRMLFVEVEDDVMSPTRPFAELMSWYTAAARTHVVAGPSELGVRQIGHFGVFALSAVSPVWDKIIDWIRG